MSPQSPVFSLESIVDALRNSIPDAEWMLGEIESQGGWFRFPTWLSDAIRNLKVESYPLLYESEAAMVSAALRGIMTPEELSEFVQGVETATPERRGELLMACGHAADQIAEEFHLPKTPKEQEEARAQFQALSPEEQQEAVKVGQHFLLAFLPSFHQNLSMMVHGENAQMRPSTNEREL